MAGDVGKNVVLPGGQAILKGLFGSGFDPWAPDNSGIVNNLFGPGGMLGTFSDPQGYTGPPMGTWDRGLQGAFIAPENQYARGALEGFYGADPSLSAVGRYRDAPERFSQWFLTGAGGLPSAQQSAGARSAANFGATNPNPQNYGPTNEIRSGIGRILGDPYFGTPLATAFEQRNAFNSFNQQNPGATPDAQRYAQAAQQAISGADPYGYGLRGINQTGRLTNDYEQQLLSDIDTQSRLSLANQLPEVQAQMQALGLSESGSATRAGSDTMKAILEQANRDKMAVMSQIRDADLARRAQAISQATALGGQGAMGQQGILGQAALGGLGDLNQMYQSQRNAEQQGIQGGIVNYLQSQLGLQDQYMRGILGGDQAQLARLMGEAGVQSQGLQDYSNIFNLSNQYHQQTLQEMLGLSDMLRGQQQEKLNEQLQFGMLPWNSLMQLITGVSTGGGVSGGNTQPVWANLLGSLGSGYVSSLGQQLGNQTPQRVADFTNWLGQ